jgi:hypothetical protein
MSYNPYSPPASRVDDSESPQVLEVRPRQVIVAIRLAAINYLLGVVAIAASWGYYSKLQFAGSTISQQFLGAALFVWIYYKIYAGRNWARITLLVLFMLTALMALSPLARNLLMTVPAITRAQMFVGLAMNLAILWLLFISPGRHWFRRIPNGPSHNKSLERTREE